MSRRHDSLGAIFHELQELGETWASRNAFAFGRQQKGVQRSQVPDRRYRRGESGRS